MLPPAAAAAAAAGGGQRRELPYEALDTQWEAREFDKFRAAAGGARQQAPYGAYLFGRLMQSDLHQSCRPALPPDVDKLNGSTIQGMCILQVVDVANIGANYELRTEFSTAGPTRTLKLGLTDGHQLVFGFEYVSLPQFSVNVPRGTKIVVENVPVRHGLLMLGPDNCQLLETSADYSGRSNGQMQQQTESNGVSAGAYSAALVTSQFNVSPQVVVSPTRSQQSTARPPATIAASRTTAVRNTNPSAASNPGAIRRMKTSSNNDALGPARNSATPSVFVDIPSSDEDMDSDTTDPMVEHLFYSPKTPRQPADVDTAAMQGNNRDVPSRKRPRSPSMGQGVGAASSGRSRTQNPVAAQSVSSTATSFLGQETKSNASTTTISPPLDPRRPFQYFKARLPTLLAPKQQTATTRFRIRACVKSVIGFQFNTGRYQLRVSVEDCTATREADVAEDFVTRLMGVPCSEFLQTMQTNVQVAHGWAATMQFALMTLEGVVTFEVTSTPGPTPLLLVDCRDFQSSDTRELLQRVKASLSRAP